MAKSKTISITIPVQLEKTLQEEANKADISRSKYIKDILLDWERRFPNDCDHNTKGYCSNWEFECVAPQSSAESCDGYVKGK